MQPTATPFIPKNWPPATSALPAAPTPATSNPAETKVAPQLPAFIDPKLKEHIEEGIVDWDGNLQLDKITLPLATPLQQDAMFHVANFMVTPFIIRGVLTDAIREKIKHSLVKRNHEPAVKQLFSMSFMLLDRDFIFKDVSIIPAVVFDTLLKHFNGNFIKLIGGESRQALANTYLYMMEVITKKPFVLSQKAKDDFKKSCPDWDFVVPASDASYEQLLEMANVIPEMVTRQIFGKTSPELDELLQFVIRESFFKLPQNFQEKYFTGISFGNLQQKIDITFVPKPEHNSIFEFNKPALLINKKAINAWMRHPQNVTYHPSSVILDISNCGPDRGYQAAWDYMMDILHSTDYLKINERGFARLMYWIGKGKICNHHEILQAFYSKVSTSQTAAAQLRLCHIDHNQGDLQALMANYLNTFVSVNLLHPDQADDFIDKIKTSLMDLFKSDHEPTTTLEILLSVIQQQKFSTRFFVDFLTICAWLAKKHKRSFYGKTALQLTDESSLLLPLNGISHFEIILKNYSAEFGSAIKLLLNRIVSSTGVSPSLLDSFSLEEREKVKNTAVEFLNHPDPTLKRIGLRLSVLFLKSHPELSHVLFSSLFHILQEENSDFAIRILTYIESVLDDSSDYKTTAIDLVAAYKRSTQKSHLMRAWMYIFLKTKHPDLIKAGEAMWNQLTPAEKQKEAQHYITAILNIYPDEALSVYNTYNQNPQIEDLVKIIKKFKSSTVPFISYGLQLEKALLKTVNSLELTRKKGSGNRASFSSDFIWLYCNLVKINPDQSSILLQKLYSNQCVDLSQMELAHTMIELSSCLTDNQFLQLWTTALECECPLLEIRSKEKNTALLRLCNAHPTKNLVLHLMTQDLSDDQIKHLQTIIMKMDKADQKMTAYLTAQQNLELNLRHIRKHVAQNAYYEAMSDIDLNWKSFTFEQQREMLEIDLMITLKLLQDIETSTDDNRQHQLNYLRPYFEKTISLFSKVDPKLVTRDLAEAWGSLIYLVIDRYIGFHSVLKKTKADPFIDTIVTFLMDHKSYQLASGLIKAFCYVEMECVLSAKLIEMLTIMTKECSVEKMDSLLSLLKFYRYQDIFPREQQDMYLILIERLLQAKNPRSVVWIEKLVLTTVESQPLPGKAILSWSQHLSEQGITWLLPIIYSKFSVISFSNVDEQHALLCRWLRESDCPYFTSSILNNHIAELHEYVENDLQEIILKILSSWLVDPKAGVTEHLMFALKLFTLKEPEIWCKALQLISSYENKEHDYRNETWLLYQISKVSRNVYEKEPHLMATACIHALHGIVGNKQNKSMFRCFIQNNELFLSNFVHGTQEQREEALDIVFSEILQNSVDLEDKETDSFIILELINTRSYLNKYLPVMGRIDVKMIAELASTGDRNILVILLAHLRKELSKTHPKEFNEAIQIVFKHLSVNNLRCWSAFCLFLINFVDKVNVFPILKAALASDNQGVHLTTSLLAHAAMNTLPTSNAEKIIVSCLTMKMADVISNDTKVLENILNSPNVLHWLSEANIMNCWERVLFYGLNHDAKIENPVTTNSLDRFNSHFNKIKLHRDLKRCLLAGNAVLLRLLIEDGGNPNRFQTELIRFYRTIFEHFGKNPVTQPREPNDLPRISDRNSNKFLKYKNKFNQSLSSIELIRKPHTPMLKFPSAEAFFEYVSPNWGNKDEVHAPILYIRETSVEQVPKMFLEISKFTPESIEAVEPEDVKDEEPVETIEYLFSTVSQRTFYVSGVTDLIQAMCLIRTKDLNLRKTVILFCARHLLHLIHNYSEFKEEIYKCLDSFVFATVAVDCHLESFRTKRGTEKEDQDIFDLHNDWCHEILTIVQFESGFKLPAKLFEALLVIYPYEQYPDQFTLSERSAIIFRTIFRLLETQSSLHQARAIEILETYQNVFLSQMNGIIPCYQKLIGEVCKQPFYLINEKHLVTYGSETDEKECLLITKRPLILLLNDTIRANHIMFKPDENKADLPVLLETAKVIAHFYIKTSLDLLENQIGEKGDFDLHYLVYRLIGDCSKRGLFAGSLSTYQGFLERFKTHVVACILAEEKKKETLFLINLPLLYTRTFRFQNKAQMEGWIESFNNLISDLLEINDAELRKFVVSFVKEKFIDNGFYRDSKTQRRRINDLLAKYST